MVKTLSETCLTSYITLKYWKHERKYCRNLYIVGKWTCDKHDRNMKKHIFQNCKNIKPMKHDKK